MGRADVYLQPHAADPVLSEATVLAIARSHTERATAVAEVDESGGEARAYLLDGGVVVKTQRPHRLRPRTCLKKEARLLEFLAEPLGDRVPAVYGYGCHQAPEGEVEYLVISRMSGRAVRHVPLTGPPRGTLLREVGALIASLHAVPIVDLDLFPVDRDGGDLGRRLESGFADLVDLIGSQPGCWSLPIRPEHAVAIALDALPATFPPVVLHSNPGPTHVFVDEGGALNGLIDFGDSYLGHPAMDLCAWPDPADRIALRSAYLRTESPGKRFEAAWTAAMVYTDMAVLANRPELAAVAAADLLTRLADW